MKHGIKLIAFDLDGTLIEGYSWTLFNAVGGVSSQEQHEWINKYSSKLIDYAQWIKLITTKYRTSNKNKTDFLAVTKTIPFKSDTHQVIRKLMSSYPIHIVSSSIDIYVEAVARHLGITSFHANHSLVFNTEGLFENITYQAPEAEAKVLYLKRLCEELNLSPQQICFVGDWLGDLSAFMFTGKGILVGKGDAKLQKAAWKQLRKAAWKQVTTLTEILPLLL